MFPTVHKSLIGQDQGALDPMDEEIAALQKRNQLIELQQRRSQLMANANLEQGSMRAIPGNNKYPVM